MRKRNGFSGRKKRISRKNWRFGGLRERRGKAGGDFLFGRM